MELKFHSNIREIAFEVKNGSECNETADGATISKKDHIGFFPAKAHEVELHILKADGLLNINEFQVFSK